MLSNRFLKKIFCLLVLIMLVLPVHGCNNYHNYTNRNGYLNFSFVYPASFQIQKDESVYPDTLIHIWKPSKPGSYMLADPSIDIFICRPSVNVTNAKALVEFDLSKQPNYDGFELLERSTVELGGVLAEQVVFSWINRSEKSSNLPQISVDMVVKKYFDFENGIGVLTMSSSKNSLVDSNIYFGRIIQTFKILD
jgi:hypothetical protein